MSGLLGNRAGLAKLAQSVESRAEGALFSGLQTSKTRSEECLPAQLFSPCSPLTQGAQGQREQQCYPDGDLLHMEAQIQGKGGSPPSQTLTVR